MKTVKDVKVIPGEECFPQHRLLIVDMNWKQRQIRKTRAPSRVKLWRLKDDKVRKAVAEGVQANTHEDETWEEWSDKIMEVATKVCGVTRGHNGQKTTWWWSEEVAEVIGRKRLLYKKWQKCKDVESKNQYLSAKKEAKRIVAVAKERASKEIVEKLEKDVFNWRQNSPFCSDWFN